MQPLSFYFEDYERPVASSQVLTSNRAFLYGEAATTCSLLRQGVVLFLEHHLERLLHSWQCFYPLCPKHLLKGKLHKNASRIPKLPGDHYVKIILFANDEQRSFERSCDHLLPNIIVYGGKYSKADRPLYLQTITRKTLPNREAKTPYFLEELQDRQRVGNQNKNGLQDILYIGPGGEVLESTVSNVFFTQRDRVLTPPLSPFILPGIARKHLISLLKDQGINLEERPIHRSELTHMQGVLLSNCLSGITVATELDGRPLHCPLALDLQQLYERSCKEYVNSYGKSPR